MPRPRKIKEVTANRFTLLDPQGRMKASFEATDDGVTCLNMYGAKYPGLAVTIDTDGNPKVNLQNKSGHTVLAMGISDDLGPGISIHDSTGRPVCFIVVGPDDVPRIRLIEMTSPNEGKSLWSSPMPETARKFPAPKKASPKRGTAKSRLKPSE